MIRYHGKRNEDYLETIYLISKAKRIIRVKDIATELQVRKSTVVSMIEKLSSEGYIEHEKYGDVFLTDKGTKKAQEVYHKHITLHSFLKDVLDLNDDISENDACTLEHHISNETTNKLLKFIEFFTYISKRDNTMQKELKNYFDKGEYPKSYLTDKNQMLKLTDIKSGENATIVSVKCNSQIKNNYTSNGIIPGTLINVVENNKSSDSMTVKIKEQVITLQKNNANAVDVEI